MKNDIIAVSVTDYGAALLSLKYKGQEVLRNHSDINEYFNDDSYMGKIVGRYANRIGNASFELDGKRFDVLPNEGVNQLHGGPASFSERQWNIRNNDLGIEFTIFSPDGDNGFPGNLSASVIYSINENSLRIDFEGETDKPTPFAPTIHTYFLSDDAEMKLNSTERLEVGNGLIPTGRIVRCEGKYEYSSFKKIMEGLDDAFIINSDNALLLKRKNYTMNLFTDFPAVQIYSGKKDSVAIEPEFYPDSPNHKNFPNTILYPGEKFHKYCEFTFSD